MLKKILSLTVACAAVLMSGPNAEAATQNSVGVTMPAAAKVHAAVKPMIGVREAAADFKGQPAPFKMQAAPAKVRRGITATPRRSANRLIGESSAVFFESFETCSHAQPFLPEGWTQSSGAGEVEDADRWIGFSRTYAEYYMFAPPVDGNMMIGIYYNDDRHKDEWLVSPQVAIPGEDYTLTFYWYTLPYYFYVIDRDHVDFDNNVFLQREKTYDLEVLVSVDGGEWEKVFNLESLFSEYEYEELSTIDFAEMQRVDIDMNPYAGKNVQVAFRYVGKGGNTVVLDAVGIDLPLPQVAYTPHYSRLFYGFSPDEKFWWLPASIEFYPVNHPITWENDSRNASQLEFNWIASVIDNHGQLTTEVSEDRDLSITYTPDYGSEYTLRNNFYYMPELRARNAKGGIGTYKAWADFLQAGGTTEYVDPDGYSRYVALQFDVINEGLVPYYLPDDDLGFYAEPIFGRSENTDAWWMHYCFPDGPRDDQFAYVDGFANMYLPHDSAPLVVKGVTAAAMGTIYPEAQFTAKVYTMTPEGYLVETPIAQKTITGADVLTISSGLTQEYLMMNFVFDEPVIFSAEGTGYGYFVEISGYRDEQIEHFVPLQQFVSNEYEWALGFYHCYRSGKEDLTEEMSYVCFFKDAKGEDYYSSFAIGLDAHYPWLERDDSAFTQSAAKTTFRIRGYYPAADYVVEAPDWVNVTLAGRYLTTVSVTSLVDLDEAVTVPVKITAPGVELEVEVPLNEGSGIEGISLGTAPRADVYNAQGICVMRKASADDLRSLPAGFYLHGTHKVLVK